MDFDSSTVVVSRAGEGIESLAAEIGCRGIRSNGLRPVVTPTPMAAAIAFPSSAPVMVNRIGLPVDGDLLVN